MIWTLRKFTEICYTGSVGLTGELRKARLKRIEGTDGSPNVIWRQDGDKETHCATARPAYRHLKDNVIHPFCFQTTESKIYIHSDSSVGNGIVANRNEIRYSSQVPIGNLSLPTVDPTLADWMSSFTVGRKYFYWQLFWAVKFIVALIRLSISLLYFVYAI